MVIEEEARFADNRHTLYNVERYERALDASNNQIGSSAQYLGASIGVGDFDTTNTGGAGSDFTFDIPAGSSFGEIRFAGQTGAHENGGFVSVRISLERDPATGALIGGTSAGQSFGARSSDPDLVAWSGVCLLYTSPSPRDS